MRAPGVLPTGFETFIAKWLVVPLMLIAVSWMLFGVSSNSQQCKKACYADGFLGHRYQPQSLRNGVSSVCFCLTAEEAADSERIHKGQRIKFQ